MSMSNDERTRILSDIRSCKSSISLREMLRRHWAKLTEVRLLTRDEISMAKGRLMHDSGFPEVVDVGENGVTVRYVETFGTCRGKFVTRHTSVCRTSLITEILDAMRRLDGDVALAVRGGVEININDVAWLLNIPFHRREAMGVSA